MAKDLTIRELNRPQVSRESQLGFQKVTRKYVVQGERVRSSELTSETDPLFLAVGTPDTEYTDHFLVNQQITPATGDMDRAYLTRDFIQLRSQFFSESSNESNDLVRVNRQYAVLRSDNATFGYGSNWAKHPNNPAATGYTAASTPWDYAPAMVTSPNQVTYSYSNDSGFADSPQVSIDGAEINLFEYLQAEVGVGSMGNWLPGKVSVTQSMPGLDIWSAEWITHATPYWTLGTAKGGSSKSIPITVVHFDHNGIKLEQFGTNSSGSFNTVARTNVFFHVGDNIPDNLAVITSGGDSSFASSIVQADFTILTTEGRSISYKKEFKNAVFNVNYSGPLEWPTYDPNLGEETVGTKNYEEIIFDRGPWTISGRAPVFQGQAVARLGGRISWTKGHRYRQILGNTSQFFGSIATKITPIFSHRGNKIWKIEITYVG